MLGTNWQIGKIIVEDEQKHYCELLIITDEQKRSFYEKECASKYVLYLPDKEKHIMVNSKSTNQIKNEGA